ncbi:hypothetical protein B0T17DRAFT_513017 [Bombardia bombarda]|uniref:F-box domain-containing protein n=1 Tax=Bombardia bombarda TaxID=252184 RepID=A0AA39XHX1_9PEZI|nr:hypothetical protein B0T17DRAFT_513017 [Bombardia bombarda]
MATSPDLPMERLAIKGAFTNLPTEIMVMITKQVDSYEDLVSLRYTCQSLDGIVTATISLDDLRHIMARSMSPYLFILCTARSISKWAFEDDTNLMEVVKAFEDNIVPLHKLCLEHGSVTWDSVRRTIRALRCNPIIRDITETFLEMNITVEPLESEPPFYLTTLQLLIYCELFASAVRWSLDPDGGCKRFSNANRMNFLRTCLTSVSASDSSFAYLPRRPRGRFWGAENMEYNQAHYAIIGLLTSKRFWRTWRPIDKATGPKFPTGWQRRMWENALVILGLSGILDYPDQAVPHGHDGPWYDMLRDAHRQVEALTLDSLLENYLRAREYSIGIKNAIEMASLPEDERDTYEALEVPEWAPPVADMRPSLVVQALEFPQFINEFIESIPRVFGLNFDMDEFRGDPEALVYEIPGGQVRPMASRDDLEDLDAEEEEIDEDGVWWERVRKHFLRTTTPAEDW